MTNEHGRHLLATCRCGTVKFEAVGTPIMTALCYCKSCQEAGQRFEQLPGAPSVLESDGGSAMLLYRKDRVTCSGGQEFLQEYRLKPASPTRRVIATCCNSAMFLDFTKGHWLSMYRNRFPADAPRPQVRVMTMDRRAGVEFSDDIPSYAKLAGKFMLKLLAAWAAMGFRKPDVTWGRK